MKITLPNHEITLPDSYADCTLDQIKIIIPVLLAESYAVLDDVANRDIKTMVIIELLTGERDFWTNLETMIDDADYYDETVHQIVRHFDFIYNDDRPSLTMTRNPYPLIENQHKAGIGKFKMRLWGPADELANMSFYELCATFTLFEAYISAPEGEADPLIISQLLATLYRPHKNRTRDNIAKAYEGDVRRPLLHHEKSADNRVAMMGQLPREVRQTLYFYFASCYRHIIDSWQDIFPQSEDSGSAPSQESDADEGNDYGWAGLLMSVAKDELVNLDKIAAQPYQNVFTMLSSLETKRKMAILRRRK